MHQDAVETPTSQGLSPDFQAEFRDKHGMTRDEAVILKGSDVDDPRQINDVAVAAARSVMKWTRQVSSADSVDPPPPAHAIVTLPHKRQRKQECWFSISALKNRLVAKPAFSGSLEIPSFRKEAGDVDVGLVRSKKKQTEGGREDGVDPNPRFAATVSKQAGSQALLVQTCVLENRDVHRCDDDDGMPVSTRKRNSQVDGSFRVNSVFYDYEDSHSVDDVQRFSVDGTYEDEEDFDSCTCCVQCSATEQSDCVDPLEECESSESIEYFQKADRVRAQNFIHEAFLDPTDGLSSSIDAHADRSRDWKPHEAETILSDIYDDLGEACICLAEDGCICSLEECQCLDQDTLLAMSQSKEENPIVTEDIAKKDTVLPSLPQQQSTSLKKPRMTQMDGTSTDVHSTVRPGLDHALSKKSKRRKNSKLSERVICKRRLSPQLQDTEVDPKRHETDVTVLENSHSMDNESVDPHMPAYSNNTRQKTRSITKKSRESKVSPDIFYSENYTTDKATPEEMSIGDAYLLDCIAAADKNISEFQTAEDSNLSKSPRAEGPIPMVFHTELSEDGFSCFTETGTKSSEGNFPKQDFLAFKNESTFVEDENANKYSSDISQTSCHVHSFVDTVDIYKSPSKIEPRIQTSSKEKVIPDPKSTQRNALSRQSPISTSSLQNRSPLYDHSQSEQTATGESVFNDRKLPAPKASYTIQVKKRVFASKIPRRRSFKTQAQGKRERGESSNKANRGNQIVSTQGRYTNFPCAASQSSGRQTKLSSRSYSKVCETIDHHSSIFEQCNSFSVGNQNEFPTDTSASKDDIEPYIPQMITFYKHKDYKRITTIPPAAPKPHRKEQASNPKPAKRPAWNYSTSVDKSRNGVRPEPLVSRRNSSTGSIATARSDSSKLSLSSARMEDSVECGTNLHRSDQKRDWSPTKRQPFIPAGANPVSSHSAKKVPPARNTARSHPDLRVPGKRVQVPVVYPSTKSRVVENTSQPNAGEKRDQRVSDKNCSCTQVLPEWCLNANCSNSCKMNLYYERILPHDCPWPFRKTQPVVRSNANRFDISVIRGPDSKHNLHTHHNSLKSNDFEQIEVGLASTPSQAEQHCRQSTSLLVPIWKHKTTRRMGSVKTAKCLKTTPPEMQTLRARPVNLFAAPEPKRRRSRSEPTRYISQVPVIDWAKTTEIPWFQSPAGTRHQHLARVMERQDEICGVVNNAHSTCHQEIAQCVDRSCVICFDSRTCCFISA